MKSRTVRELGGEISAKIYTEQDLLLARDDNSLKNLDYLTLNKVIDLMMSVLARHTKTVIVNDQDFPVVPLPEREEFAR